MDIDVCQVKEIDHDLMRQLDRTAPHVVIANTRERLDLAEKAGADYIGVGALRGTPSKPDTTVIGLEGIEDICRAAVSPVLAIGGIQPADVSTLLRIGVTGVAVSSGILEAPDPENAARAYREALDNV